MMPSVADETEIVTKIETSKAPVFVGYPYQVRKAVIEYYNSGQRKYEGVAISDITQPSHTDATRGANYLFLGLYRLLLGDPEDEVWDNIRLAREHGSVDAMVMFGHAFEHGLAGYRRDLNLAEKNFRRAGASTWKRVNAPVGKKRQFPNYFNKFQLERFLLDHPDRRLSPDEAKTVGNNAADLLVAYLNLHVHGGKVPKAPESARDAERIIEHLLQPDLIDVAFFRLAVAEYFNRQPALDRFADSHRYAFRLRESVYREFPDEYARHSGLNFDLATHYAFGEGTDKDMARAIFHYRVAAEEGSVVAAVNLSVFRSNNETDIDWEGQEPLPLLLTFADRFAEFSAKRSADIAFMIGVLYGNGYGTPVNDEGNYLWTRLGLDFEARPGPAKTINEFHATLTEPRMKEHEEAYEAFRLKLGLEGTDQ